MIILLRLHPTSPHLRHFRQQRIIHVVLGQHQRHFSGKVVGLQKVLQVRVARPRPVVPPLAALLAGVQALDVLLQRRKGGAVRWSSFACHYLRRYT